MGGSDERVPDDGDRSGVAPSVAHPDHTDDVSILPEHSTDDTDAGWGEAPIGNDERLLADRPPHWG